MKLNIELAEKLFYEILYYSKNKNKYMISDLCRLINFYKNDLHYSKMLVKNIESSSSINNVNNSKNSNDINNSIINIFNLKKTNILTVNEIFSNLLKQSKHFEKKYLRMTLEKFDKLKTGMINKTDI